MELTAVNQLWVADITYIRLETEFVYLAVMLDAFSRRVIGWESGPNSGGRSWRSHALRWQSGDRRPGWRTIPTAGCSTLPRNTPIF